MSTDDGTIAAGLAGFVGNLQLDDVPAAVRTRSRLLFLDMLGAALASSTFAFARSTVDGLAGLGTGDSTVIGLPVRLPLRDAALANGILVHGLDYDDTSILGRVHPSSSCGPAALAVGAQVGATGAECLLAYIAGLECAIRVGAVARGGLQRSGFHPTGVVGVFGATMVAGRLLALDARQLVMAQGIALSMASGAQEFATEGAWTKRLHPGWAATAGITAAALAKGGFVGPTRPYEGKFGLFATYMRGAEPGPDLDAALDGLGSAWRIETVAVKPLPACYFNVPVIDAAIRLAAEHDLQPGAIARATALVPEAAINLVCAPEAAKRRPTDAYGAQFSAVFCAATALARRRFGLDDLDAASLTDPEILGLVDRTDWAVDPQSTFPRFYSGGVVVETRDGRTLEAHEPINRGAPERPLPPAEMVAKFQASAGRVFAADRIDRIIAAVDGIETLPDIGSLTALLSTADHA